MSGATPLLERGEELEALRLHLTRAAGDGGIAVIAGAGGVGKTRLLKAVRLEAADLGLRTLSARCSLLEAGFRFGVVRQIFEPVLAGPAVQEALAGPAAPAAPLLAPGSAEDGAEPSYVVLDALYRLTLAVARGPVVVLVDDLQWCDEPSLRWLAYIARRLEGTGLAVVATLARGAGALEGRIERELVDDPSALVLTPRPLSERATGDLVAEGLRRMPEPGFVRACHELSGGNPLLLTELVRDLATAGLAPTDVELERLHDIGRPSVARSVLQRLERLPGPAGALAAAVAVLDGDGDLDLGAELAGLEPAAARQAVTQLREAGILAPDGARFAHAAVRDTVYGELPAADRARRHARAARRLAAAHAADDVVAEHLLATRPGDDEDPGWVLRALRLAAARASERGAPAAAAALLRRALDESLSAETRRTLLAELGRAEALTGDPAAVSHLRSALADAADAEERLGLAVDLGRALVRGGRPGDAISVLQAALDHAADAVPPALALRAEAELTTATRQHREPHRQVPERLRAAVRDLPREAPAARLLVGSSAVEAALSGSRSADSAATLAEDAWAGGRLLRDEGPHSTVVLGVGLALVLTERDDVAGRVLGSVAAEGRRVGSPAATAPAVARHADLHLRAGRLAEAETAAREALAAGGMEPAQLGTAVATLVRVLVERGDLDAGEAALGAAGLAGTIPDSPPLDGVLFARGLLRAAQGLPEQAVADFDLCGSRQAAWGAPNPAHLPWRSHLAVQLALAGEAARARAVAREEVERARAFGAPRALGIALRGAALATRGAEAIGLLRDAAETLAVANAPLDEARVLVELGAAVRRDGRRADARPHLVRGQELAERCGAWGLVSRARDELLTAGARPRRARAGGVDGLTAGERRAAELAATGRSNREIAQALYLAPKTIEMHLSSAYRKLDIKSRAQLAEVLGPRVAAT
ncbi:MAG TPA: AAA family ATPase [Solirubrobacteraceae bacterium]|nr:AAA family ATPase [Solirubrobacteraceae bacterium]